MSRTLECEVTGFGFRAEQVGSPFGWGGGIEEISIIILKLTLKAIHKKLILHLF